MANRYIVYKKSLTGALLRDSRFVCGWRKNTTNEPLAISKLLLVVRAWIDEQNKINNLLSISCKAKLKLKPDCGKILTKIIK